MHTNTPQDQAIYFYMLFAVFSSSISQFILLNLHLNYVTIPFFHLDVYFFCSPVHAGFKPIYFSYQNRELQYNYFNFSCFQQQPAQLGDQYLPSNW